MIIKDFREKIAFLIDLHQEGPYWDFKREWYKDGKQGDLLHDIICMSNNQCNLDAYIIIGVDEEQNYQFIDVSKDQNRKNTQKIVDFLKDKKFAGDMRPVVYVNEINLSGCALDVIVIQNTTNTPYFLKEDYRQVLANHIYTRIQDTNTPINSSADLHHIEYLWRKRFGLTLAPLEKIQLYLKNPKDWVDAPSNSEVSRKYYRYAPEYVIEHTFHPEDDRNGYEFYLFAQTDHTPHWSEIRLYYHQTMLAKIGGVFLDGGRYYTSTPLLDGFSSADKFEWDVTYKYMIKDSLEYIIHEFYYDEDEETSSTIWAHEAFTNCILFFDSEDEHQHFNIFAKENWAYKEQYMNNIRKIHFPNLNGYRMETFEEQYINSQILKLMQYSFWQQENYG